MRAAVFISLLLATPCFADALVLSGTHAGALVQDGYINPNTFYFQFAEYDIALGYWNSPAVAEGSTIDTIPVPYPEPQVWTITAANAVDFGLDWGSLEAAFANPHDLMLRFGMGLHPGLNGPEGVVWSTFGTLGILNGALTRGTIVRDGVTIQSGNRDRPGWSLITMDVQQIQFQRILYDWETCNNKWCFGEPFEGLHGHVEWSIAGDGQLAVVPPPGEPDVPEPAAIAMSLPVMLIVLSGVRARPRRHSFR